MAVFASASTREWRRPIRHVLLLFLKRHDARVTWLLLLARNGTSVPLGDARWASAARWRRKRRRRRLRRSTPPKWRSLRSSSASCSARSSPRARLCRCDTTLGSPDWRAWSARAESRLGFNAEVGAGGARRLPGLEPGWLFGRANDLSDTQWRSFRGQLLLALAALVTAPAVAVARRLLGARAMPAFHALYGAAFVSYLHGVRALWIAALILVHHRLCRRFAGAPFLGPAAAWVSALAALVASQFWAHSWTFARLARLAPSRPAPPAR